jgi:hypothetical protein
MHATRVSDQWAKVRVPGIGGIETDHVRAGRSGARQPHILPQGSRKRTPAPGLVVGRQRVYAGERRTLMTRLCEPAMKRIESL